MIKIKALSLLFFCCCLVIFSYAQSAQKERVLNVIPPSPTAAALGKYGEIPVGTYTGIPEISIPIYEIKEGALTCPVNLSYHGGGIKVEEVASWAGLGWSLRAGGAITRGFRGLPDESQSYFNPANDPTNPSQNYLVGVAEGNIDGESDVYNFSFGKFSGTFFFDRSGEIYTVPLSNFKITKTTAGWRFTDADGSDYFFETAEYTKTAKYCQSGAANTLPAIFENSPTSWLLTLIVSGDKVDSIQFEYEPFNSQYRLNPVETRYQLLWSGAAGCTSSNDLCTSTNYINGKRLKKAKFKNGYINFVANTNREDLIGDKRLDLIEIFNGDGSVYKKYQFYYSYFLGTGGGCAGTEDLKRLRLDSLSALSGSVRIPPHSFIYDDQQVPCRLGLAVDQWGYYNGAWGNSSLIPTFTYEISGGGYGVYHGADRSVNPNYAKAGVLKKIIYPTGGSTTFEYESNTIWKEGEYSNTKPNHAYIILAPPQQNYVQNFSVNFAPSNLNFMLGGVFGNISVDKLVDFNNGTTANAYLEKLDAGGSVLSRLVLEQGDIPNYHLENGNYRLRAELPFPISNGPSLNPGFHVAIDWEEPDTASSSQFLVGGLRVKQISDVAANNEKINVHNFNYNYANNRSSGAVLLTNNYVHRMTFQKLEIDPLNGVGTPYYCDCLVRQAYTSFPLTPASASHIGYQLVTVTDVGKGYSTFEYTNPATNPDELLNAFPYAPSISHGWQRGLLLKQSDYMEGGTTPIHITRNIYSDLSTVNRSLSMTAGYDFISELPSTVPPQRMVYSVYSAFPYLESTYDTLFDGSNHALYIATKKIFNYTVPAFLPSKTTTNSSKGAEIITEYKYPADYNNTAMQGRIGVLKQKNILSPIIATTTTRDGKLIAGKINSYNEEGKLLEQYDLESATLVTKPAFDPSNIIPAADLFTLKNLVSYDPLSKRLSEVKPINDRTTVYLWGYKSTLPVVKIEGSSYQTVKSLVDQTVLDNPASQQQLVTELNKVRTGLAATKALITTYTYAPLIGMVTQTDPDGRVTYYDYDNIGRLKVVRDQNGKILKQYDYGYQRPVNQ